MGIGRTMCYWGIAVCLGMAAAAHADPPPESNPARPLLEQAWQAEIRGSAEARERLLKVCLKNHPQTREAHWLAGQVQHDGEWIGFADLSAQWADNEALREYRQVRSQFAMTAEEQVKLADWCRTHRLYDRERIHLTAALELSDNPNDPVLRNRLGFRLVNGTWRTQADIEELDGAQAAHRQSLRTWVPKIRKLALQRGSRRDAVWQKAEAELKAIVDRDALPALEAVLSSGGLGPARLLVEILGQFPSHKAAGGLARLAVLSPWKVVREEATKQLRSRPYGSYAPELLSALRAPVSSRIQLLMGRGGVHLLQRFSSETQTAHQLLETRSSRYIALASRRRPSDRDRNRLGRTAANAALEARLRASEIQGAVEAQNQQIEDRNERICQVLRDATGFQLPEEPAAWWSWWGDFNQMTEEEKEEQYVWYDWREVEIVEESAPIVQPLETSPRTVPITRVEGPRECLVAGTLVWTDRGSVPVESVQVGDLALAQDSETGELSYQPVLRTTIREEQPVLKATTAAGEIRSTGGHTFWIAGQGWTKLRDAKPGQHFHAVSGPVEIKTIEPAGSEKTYNLLVSDMHTYFVGNDLVLSHDVTLARPSDALVPGYLR